MTVKNTIKKKKPAETPKKKPVSTRSKKPAVKNTKKTELAPIYRPSSASRWMACTMSSELYRKNPEFRIEQTSIYALEGKFAHAVAEKWIETGKCPASVTLENDGEKLTHKPDEEMIQYVSYYVNYIKSERHDAEVCEIEKKFEGIIPGTADCVIVKGNILSIIDLKYGAGIPVYPKDNKQIKTYLMLAKAYYEKLLNRSFDYFVGVIVQPRKPDGEGDFVHTHTYSEYEILMHEREIEKVLNTAYPEYHEGEHCGFCRAKLVCERMASIRHEIAKQEFAELNDFDPPAIETITPEKLSFILKNKKLIESFLDDAQAHALSLAKKGINIPGFTLTPSFGYRQWIDEKKAEKFFTKELGHEAVHVTKLASPAQIEKLAGKNVVAKFTHRPEKGSVLAPVEAGRISRGASDFKEIE